MSRPPLRRWRATCIAGRRRREFTIVARTEATVRERLQTWVAPGRPDFRVLSIHALEESAA